VIAALDLKKYFGPVAAVDGVTFTAHDGQVTGLLGPNGAGKTTTLRMLYSVMRPDGGTIEVDHVDATKYPRDAQARLGVLPDIAGLYPRLTAREQVHYYGELHGLDGPALEERTNDLLKTLDLMHLADRRAAGYSHGERTKVAIARALVHEPQNIILDEPTNGLDVMSTRAVRAIIKRLKAQGRCVLFSSHVMQEVEQLCDEVVVIAGGQVVAAGTLADIRARGGDRLEDAFVALMEPGEPQPGAKE